MSALELKLSQQTMFSVSGILCHVHLNTSRDMCKDLKGGTDPSREQKIASCGSSPKPNSTERRPEKWATLQLVDQEKADEMGWLAAAVTHPIPLSCFPQEQSCHPPSLLKRGLPLQKLEEKTEKTDGAVPFPNQWRC